MKIIKRILLSLAILLGLVITTGVVIAYVYEDDVKHYALGKLSDYFVSEVVVEDVDLSLISKFPYASIDFKNILIKDAYRDTTIERDTFFYADHVFLEFNIIDLFNEDYTIRKVDVQDGMVALHVNEEGDDNYHILKQREDTTASEAFAFALEDVVADNVAVTYINDRNGQDYSFERAAVYLKGDFNKDSFALAGQSECFVNHFIANGVDYAHERPAMIDVVLDVNTLDNVVAINAGHVKVEELLFDVDGKVQIAEDVHCDFLVKGNNIDIRKMYSLLPDKFAQKLNGYDSKGKLEFTSTIKGNVSGEHTPEVIADFSIDNGKLTQTSTAITLGNLSMEGNYTKPADKTVENLTIKNLSASLKDGNITANIKVKDFANPKLDVGITGNLNLADVQDFVQMDTIEHLAGRIDINTQFSGKAKALQRFTSEYFKRSKASGEIAFKNTTVQFKGHPMQYENVNGKFVLKNNDAAIKDLQGIAAGSDFKLNGFFRNFLNYIFLPDQKLTIEASFESEKVDLDQLLTMHSDEAASSSTGYHLRLPAYVNCNLKARIGALTFRRFEASDIRGVVKLKDGQLYFDPLKFNYAEGSISIDGSIDGRDPSNFVVSCKSKVKNLDVHKTFYQFENFGQTFIEDRHLKGKANADITLLAVVDEQLNFDRNQLSSVIDVTLRDGELIGFETLEAMSSYMAGNRMIRAFVDVDALDKKLDHIYFSELSNRIEIKDQVITIPKMLIASSAMDINIAGIHGFDNTIDYSFDFKLSEILKRKDPDSEFGEIMDDGTGASIFITMKGTTDNFEFSYDRKGARNTLKENIAQEKQTIKEVMKTEFGMFKNDTSVGTYTQPTDPAPEFIIEWEEFEDPDQTSGNDDGSNLDFKDANPDAAGDPRKEEKKKKNNNSRFNKFLKKLEDEGKENEEVGFEIEDQ